MAEPKQRFSKKFYLGVFLVLLSFVLGKITQTIFVIYFNDEYLRWFSIIVYILSWPMLIIGVWLVGKEYARSLKRYFTYRFYHESVKSGTKKVYGKAKERFRRKKQ